MVAAVIVVLFLGVPLLGLLYLWFRTPARLYDLDAGMTTGEPPGCLVWLGLLAALLNGS